MVGSRSRLAALIALVMVASTLSFMSFSIGERADRGRDRARPNIVVVLTDDMRADELEMLPSVQRLQRRGSTFTNFRAANPICCPSRATLLTGKLSHNTRTVGNHVASRGGYRVFRKNNDVHDLLPVWLRSGGYRTSYIGKYLNGFEHQPRTDQPGWHHFAVPDRNPYRFYRNEFAVNGTSRPQVAGYREHVTRRMLLGRIRQWGPSSRPYFVLYNSLAPHAGFRAGKDTWGAPVPELKYRRTVSAESLDPAPSVREDSVTGDGSPADLTDKSSWLHALARHQGGHRYHATGEQLRRESLKSVDDTVAAAVEEVGRQGELDNTVFVFTSDNGYQLGEHGLGGKNKPYAESVDVPLVIAGPGFDTGDDVTQDASFADLTQTILRISGDRSRHQGDGVPLRPLTRDPDKHDDRPVLLEGSTATIPWHSPTPTPPTDRMGRFYTGVVFGDFTLIRYATGDREFYRGRADPWQMENVYSRTRPSRMQRKLEAWRRQHVDCLGRSCNTPLSRVEPVRTDSRLDVHQ